MSNSKKSTPGAQTPATLAAGRLESFSASYPPTLARPCEPATTAGIAVDQLSSDFAKQRTSLWEDVSLFIKEVR